jgi:hypothetical protein
VSAAQRKHPRRFHAVNLLIVGLLCFLTYKIHEVTAWSWIGSLTATLLGSAVVGVVFSEITGGRGRNEA